MEIMEIRESLNEAFKNKNVVVTGNTGFKGSWLSLWLLQLGANVVGISHKKKCYRAIFISNFKIGREDDVLRNRYC